MNFSLKGIPVDKKWAESISLFKCPQCHLYGATDAQSLERHVILLCGSRSALAIQAVRQLTPVVEQSEEDQLDVVKLVLEVMLLRWKKEGMPEIPAGLQKHGNEDGLSHVLTLWRLWLQEIDEINREYPVVDLLRLGVESEQITEASELKHKNPSFSYSANDYNYELMAQIAEELTKLPKCDADEDIDASSVSRLEKEALYLFSSDQ